MQIFLTGTRASLSRLCARAAQLAPTPPSQGHDALSGGVWFCSEADTFSTMAGAGSTYTRE